MPIIPKLTPITKQDEYEKDYSAAKNIRKFFLRANLYRFVKMKRDGKAALAGKVEELEGTMSDKNREIKLLKDGKTILTAKVDELERENKNLKGTNDAKDKLFNIIGHDLKNPLGSIMSFSEILVDEIESMPPDEAIRMAVTLNTAAKSVSGLLGQLIEWSKRQSGGLETKPGNFDMLDVIEKTDILLAGEMKRKGLKQLAFEIGDMDTRVYADEDMASAIVRNLINNAIKFTAAGGTITVSAFKAENGFRGFAVKDTGVGMSKERVKSLFDLSNIFSTKGTAGEPGTGLGLQLVKEFVEKNGGNIWVESELGKGTAFYFTLPAAKEEARKTT